MRRNAPNVVFYFYNCQLLDEVEQNIVICRGRAVQINYLLRESRYIENITWLRGNMKFISSVEQDISRVSEANE